jgi:sirohydrochlorin cobaltochelatase
MKDSCLIIVSHGSKNKAWLKPVEKLTFSLKKKFGKTGVHTAYLENVKPDLKTVLGKLASTRTITILPLFISCGNHIKNDIKKDIIKHKKHYKNTKINLLPSLGENPGFETLVISCCLRKFLNLH